jgi:hypothetical protein
MYSATPPGTTVSRRLAMGRDYVGRSLEPRSRVPRRKWLLAGLHHVAQPFRSPLELSTLETPQRIPHRSVARIDEIHDHRGISRVLTATYEGNPFLFSGRFHRREDPTLMRSLSKLTGVQVETEMRGLARGSTN